MMTMKVRPHREVGLEDNPMHEIEASAASLMCYMAKLLTIPVEQIARLGYDLVECGPDEFRPSKRFYAVKLATRGHVCYIETDDAVVPDAVRLHRVLGEKKVLPPCMHSPGTFKCDKCGEIEKTSHKKMLFAFDYEGTISEDIEMWLVIIAMIKARGHDVLIASMCTFAGKQKMDERVLDLVPWIVPTSGLAKLPFLANVGIHPDVWMDDQPQALFLDADKAFATPQSTED